MAEAIGMIEYKTVSSGIMATDILSKSAYVKILEARVLTPGKFVVLYTGELGAVRAAMEVATRYQEDKLLDKIVLGSPDLQVMEVLDHPIRWEEYEDDAIGMVETSTVSSAVLAADFAAKTANIKLLEIRLATRMGGKGYILFSGSVAAVREAVYASESRLSYLNTVLDTMVIPKPSKDLVESLYKD